MTKDEMRQLAEARARFDKAEADGDAAGMAAEFAEIPGLLIAEEYADLEGKQITPRIAMAQALALREELLLYAKIIKRQVEVIKKRLDDLERTG